jgi:hypothetical protein
MPIRQIDIREMTSWSRMLDLVRESEAMSVASESLSKLFVASPSKNRCQKAQRCWEDTLAKPG